MRGQTRPSAALVVIIGVLQCANVLAFQSLAVAHLYFASAPPSVRLSLLSVPCMQYAYQSRMGDAA